MKVESEYSAHLARTGGDPSGAELGADEAAAFCAIFAQVIATANASTASVDARPPDSNGAPATTIEGEAAGGQTATTTGDDDLTTMSPASEGDEAVAARRSTPSTPVPITPSAPDAMTLTDPDAPVTTGEPLTPPGTGVFSDGSPTVAMPQLETAVMTDDTAAVAPEPTEFAPSRFPNAGAHERDLEAFADGTDAVTPVSATAPAGAKAPAAPAPMVSPSTPSAPTPEAPPTQQLVAVLAPLRLRGDGNATLSLMLRPDDLGRVDVELRIERGTMHLTMRAEQPGTAELLRTAMDELRGELHDQGISTGDMTVGEHAHRDKPQREQTPVIDHGADDETPVTSIDPLATDADALVDVRM